MGLSGLASSLETNVVTGPNERDGFVIIPLKLGEHAILVGRPSVRYFRRRNV